MSDREIKFRAWDKVIGKMNMVTGLSFSPRNDFELKRLDCALYKDITTWLDRDQYELMQYTGFKDKNGKEIYEGDILEYPETSCPLIIKWDDLTSSYYLEEIESCGAEPMPYMDSMEQYGLVIGNIYENKELLDANKDSMAKG